jgi:hypothetical protein
VSTTTSRTQPALIGGLIAGVLSALPFVSAGNLCCCLWVVSGGAAAAYVLQQNQPAAITPGDGAVVGLFAGVIGAVVWLVLSIPITFLIGPMEQRLFQRITENMNSMPPEFRAYMGPYVGGSIRLAVFFICMLFVGPIFSTLGGLLGAVIFRKPQAPPGPPGTIDVGPAA